MNKKLANATQHFYLTCLVKLEKKEKEGYIGWDDPKNAMGFKSEIEEHFKREIITQDDLVDISNYCNFLWNGKEAEKEKEEREYHERKHYREVIQSES